MASYPSHQPSPRLLRKRLAGLPGHYLHVLLQPSPQTFAEQEEMANWPLIWVQLLIWSVLSAALDVLARLLWSTSPRLIDIGFLRFGVVQTPMEALGAVIGLPLGFFLWMGMLSLTACLFGGQGRFLEQCAFSLLFLVPLGIVSSVLGLLPWISFLSIILFIYGIVLQVFAMMATYHLSANKAIGLVCCSALFMVLLALIFVSMSTPVRST